jgi:hypothetical protein
MNYYTDKWVIVELSTPKKEIIYKIAGSWFGGYMGSDSWKISSGLEPGVILDKNNFYVSPQTSGSVYHLHPDVYGMSMYTESIIDSYIKQLSDIGASMRVLSKDDALLILEKFKG